MGRKPKRSFRIVPLIFLVIALGILIWNLSLTRVSETIICIKQDDMCKLHTLNKLEQEIVQPVIKYSEIKDVESYHYILRYTTFKGNNKKDHRSNRYGVRIISKNGETSDVFINYKSNSHAEKEAKALKKALTKNSPIIKYTRDLK